MGKIKITEQQLADLIAMNTIDKPIGKIMTLDDIEEATTTSSAFPAKPKVKEEDLESIENSTSELKAGVDSLGKALGELNITNNRANIGSNKKIKHSNHQTHMMEDNKEDKYKEGFFDEIETYLSSKKGLDERLKRDWGSARKSMNEHMLGGTCTCKKCGAQAQVMDRRACEMWIQKHNEAQHGGRMTKDDFDIEFDELDTHTFKKNRMMRRPYSSKYNRKGL
tara:strand:- start:178 stop:846 length:669 start_codon:yes stop_codon:yes gene_type:complete